MITAKEWVNEHMKLIGLTEDEIYWAKTKNPEEVKMMEDFFKSIQDDAIKSVVPPEGREE